ncbi:MAG: hypothetical protein K2X47_06215, partial [Bdellovibrionales bacterium]|nr:hypothetical protein [Bdellovibrionales bacterium]
VRSRVELSRRFPRHRKTFGTDWYGVIFQRNQFNPAVSKKSAFRKLFMCPQKSPRFIESWARVRETAEKVTDKHSLSPLVTTPFEKSEGYSLVTHLYYPQSIQATNPPAEWVTAKKKEKLEVRGLKLDGVSLSDECLWMYREKKNE